MRERGASICLSIRNTAFCMMVSILGFCISIFFSAISYRYYLPSLVGLTIAFSAAAQREMNSVFPRPGRALHASLAPQDYAIARGMIVCAE